MSALACECFWTPESEWLSAASCGYGSGYEPGSQMEWNPDCPVHPGTPSTADLCNECNLPVTEDDAAPSCGAHALHIHCAGWFHCRECYQIRSEIP